MSRNNGGGGATSAHQWASISIGRSMAVGSGGRGLPPFHRSFGGLEAWSSHAPLLLLLCSLRGSAQSLHGRSLATQRVAPRLPHHLGWRIDDDGDELPHSNGEEPLFSLPYGFQLKGS
jgi:hypothetical protein